jgi:hypothetical protein
VPSVTCWSQRSASVSISMTLAHALVANKSLDA